MAPPSTQALSKMEKDFRAQDDLRTLTQAEEIRTDPSRVKHLSRHLKKQQRALSRTSKSLASGGKALAGGKR